MGNVTQTCELSNPDTPNTFYKGQSDFQLVLSLKFYPNCISLIPSLSHLKGESEILSLHFLKGTSLIPYFLEFGLVSFLVLCDRSRSLMKHIACR